MRLGWRQEGLQLARRRALSVTVPKVCLGALPSVRLGLGSTGAIYHHAAMMNE